MAKDREALSDWSQKYRPRSLEEMILPTSIKRPLIAIRDRQVGPHLLFHGKHGTGKTTASVLLLNDRDRRKYFDVRNQNYDHLFSQVLYAANEQVKKGVRSIVILDSADCLPRKHHTEFESVLSQPSLSMYVATAVLPKRLSSDIHACMVNVDFDQMIGDADLRQQMYVRMMEILESETTPRKDEVVRSIVFRWFPDMRQIVNRIQFEVGHYV